MTVVFTAPLFAQNLIHDRKPKFIPVKIHPQHLQLKNYLSARCVDYIYYTTNHDIYALNLATKKRRLVQRLKWKPFCLDAAYDWICVGSKTKGQCAFIEIKTEADDPTLPLYHHAEVDDLLPLDLDPESRSILNQGLSSSRPQSRMPKYICHEAEIGEDIVNSVSIHSLSGGKEGLEDEIVAILTNNDKTVTIFSLTKKEPLCSPPRYPIAMNHATISPDGDLLLAVGDKAQAFFHRRVFKETMLKGQLSWAWEWQEICAPRLSLVRKDDCCFSTGFSPSGHICATASQTGVLTVFDTALIREDMDDDDAVVGIIRSSRPNVSTHRGAIRSMSFSPGPWDLLALAEDQGRVTILDLRNAFYSAQTLLLEPSSDNVEFVAIVDQQSTLDQRQLDIERRFFESHEEALAARDNLAAVSNTADYMEYSADQRRRDRDVLNSELETLRSHLRTDTHRLTEYERGLIDAIGSRQSSGSAGELVTPMSVNYPSGSNRYLPSVGPWDSASVSSRPQNRHTASIAEYMALRNSERSRLGGERLYHPRRRSSVVVSQNQANATPSSTYSNTLAPITTRSSNLSASPSRLPTTAPSTEPNHSSTDEPWQTISNAMGSDTGSQWRMQRLQNMVASIRDGSLRNQEAGDAESANQIPQIQTLRQLESRNERQRELNRVNAQRLTLLRGQQRRLDDEDEDLIGDFDARPDPADGVVTMGVGWSQDGRDLFIATEEGIFQYQVNITRRCQFPGMSWL